MPLPSNPSSPTRSPGERRFVRQIGLHHFAYLRAVAEGLDVAECAARYLGTEHGHEARSAHQQTVDAVRAIARRRSEPWRLVGLLIKSTGTQQPTLEAFAEGRLASTPRAARLRTRRPPRSATSRSRQSHGA